MQETNEHFHLFAKSLERAIEKYGETPEEELLARQKAQVEKLVGLETLFRKTLVAHRWGPGVYRSFIEFICDKRKNILAARPYFRERQGVFTAHISKALKKRSEAGLYKFHFNFQFVRFTLRSRKWGKSSKILDLASQISEIRTELIEMNMPLAISRARIFWSRTPKAELSYMDFIQIASEGLMSAVDKFCLPYSRVFRAVIIGRALGNFIESASDTVLHFYPGDKRKLYRANKLVGKYAGVVDYEKLANDVNIGMDAQHCTSPDEIAGLMKAASAISADFPVGLKENPENTGARPVTGVESIRAPLSCQPDVIAENNDSAASLFSAIGSLSCLERKLLAMKGIQV